jgi:hypothetical protein
MNSTTYYVASAALGALGALALVCGHLAKQKESDRGTVELRSLIRSLARVEEKFWKKYPFGYILFSRQEGEPRQVYPLFNRNESHPSPVADWKDTTIALDAAKKTFSVSVPNPAWGPIPNVVIGKALSHGAYTLGQPIELNAVHAEGFPNMYLEVVDDDPNQQVCVIGFKK